MKLPATLATLTRLTCLRCGKVWIPRVDNPLRCPACIKNWRQPRKEKRR